AEARGGDRPCRAGAAERFLRLTVFEERDDETRGERVPGSRPVDRDHVWWPGARDLLAVLQQDSALLAHRQGQQRLLADDLGLVTIRDYEVRFHDEGPRRRSDHAPPLDLRAGFF